MSKEIHPAMHTAEHILNQTMVRMFGCDRCFSAHIEKKKSKCDYRFEHELSGQEISEIEQKVNKIISDDLSIEEEYIDQETAKQKYNLGRLPEDADNDIKIIKIGDYDVCPCIGPHVNSTKEIGVFKIISSSFNDNILRIRYKLLK